MVQPIPDGYARVTPYLIVCGASAAIDFYTSALGATERMRMPMKGGVSAEASVASTKDELRACRLTIVSRSLPSAIAEAAHATGERLALLGLLERPGRVGVDRARSDVLPDPGGVNVVVGRVRVRVIG